MVEFLRNDLEFILDQIKIAERHAAGEDLRDLIPNALEPLGLRTVDGTYNNLIPGREEWGAADTEFPRLLTPEFQDADPVPFDFDGDGPVQVGDPTSYAQTDGIVIDSQPREISNLIVDQTSNNPAAVAAAEREGSEQVYVGPGADGMEGTADDQFLYFIPNQAPDEGLSAPFNSWMTLFGQFFDHGLDLVNKGGSGAVFIPLSPDDPLYDGNSQTNFMVVTRATNNPGPDGVLGTADDIREHTNDTTPFVDQNQTYTSHASHQVFVREYELNGDNVPVATGHLIEGDAGGMSQWKDIKLQAATLLGIELDDQDALNVPLLATDQYGNFIRGANGFPQIVLADNTLLEGNPAAPIDASLAVRTGHAFLEDISNFANPNGKVADADTIVNPHNVPLPEELDGDGNPIATYDNELLDLHYIAGDGRANENIGLTAVHHVFHSEHNRLVEHTKQVILDTNDPDFIAEWQMPDGSWNGERLFQAAKFGTEMQYQHLVFEEFGRKVQPLINVFGSYDTEIDPTIVAEFAHVVYRFGHSMLTETVSRITEDDVANGTVSDVDLITAFLNPVLFEQDGSGNPLNADEAAAAVARGMTRQTGNEIDEFVTDALRSNLLGLPLDLAAINIARGRETGVPGLNAARREFFDGTGDTKLKPYDSWFDFTQNLKNQLSIVNFIAAYGTHDTIVNAATIDDKREAAMAIVFQQGNSPADRLDFLNGTGAWADVDGLPSTGLEDVDFWIGGLAEAIEPFGGMLGSTFNFVFEEQMEALQDGDRFYYLARTAGLNFLTQLEQNSFAGMIARNTSLNIDENDPNAGNTHLPGDIFASVDYTLEINQQYQIGPDPEAEPGSIIPLVIRVDPRNPGNTNYLEFTGGEHVVLGGTNQDDTLIGGIGDDTIWGDAGNDIIEGGDGGDILIGGAGDDIITDIGGANNLQGGDGNDAIFAGGGEALILAGAGKDFVYGGPDLAETFGGAGDDFLNAGDDANTLFAGEGDDWIEGGNGNDLLQGDNGAPFQDSTIIGNDVFIGGGGDDDYDAESGDDIMFGDPGIERNEGMLGFDWVTYARDDFGVEADMNFRAFNVAPIPPSQEVVLDRFDQVEGLSGSQYTDFLRGDDATNLEMAQGLNGLDNILRNFDLINGLRGTLAEVQAGNAIFVNTTTEWGFGNIILGGDGSDQITGRGGDDIIDGDSWLNVQLEAPDGMDGMGRYDSMDELRARVFAGELNPGDINIVREIIPGAANSNFDTAEYSGLRGEYFIEGSTAGNSLGGVDVDGDGYITVAHNDPNAPDGIGLGEGVDGLDLIRNIERLRFSDGTTLVLNGGFDNGDPNTGTPLNAEPVGEATIVASDPTQAIGVGVELRATVAGITDADNVSSAGAITGPLRIIWQEDLEGTGNFTDIIIFDAGGNDAPASGPTYVPTDDQLGISIRAVVSYVDENGTPEKVFSAPAGPLGASIIGSDNPNVTDVLDGTIGNDNIVGLAGNDVLNGLDGNDVISGGEGNDIIDGGAGLDTLNGNGGADTIIGGADADIIRGGEGGDNINGNGGADDIDGGLGDDTIFGGAGNDIIRSGGGNDTVDGGAGTDELLLTGHAIDYTVTNNPDGSVTYTDNNALDGDEGSVTVTNVEIITFEGDIVNDAPVVNDEAIDVGVGQTITFNVLDNDTDVNGDDLDLSIAPVAGSGTIVAFDAETGSVTYTAPAADGVDTISYTVTDGELEVQGTVLITVGNPAPTPVDDAATTDEDTPVIISVLANDSDLVGDPISVTSIDTTGTLGLVSINPDGTITYDPNGAFEALNDGETGADSFTYTVTDGTNLSTATVSVTIDGVSDQVLLPLGDVMLTDAGERFITRDPGGNEVMAGDGLDVVLGSGGADVLAGGAGSDTLNGEAGDDVLIGGLGNDILRGGADADVFVVDGADFTGPGGDTIQDFEVGVDTLEISGFAGINTVGDITFTQLGTSLRVNLGTNQLVILENLTQAALGANDIQVVPTARTLDFGVTPTVTRLTVADDRYINTSGTTGQVVDGHDGIDTIILGSGDDTLIGNTGSDTLSGGGGADILNGGLGNDIMTGGAGADQFTFAVGDFVGQMGDQITDFVSGEDTIELAGFGFTDVADLSFINVGIGDAIVLDTEQLIILQGIDSTTLTNADFVFTI